MSDETDTTSEVARVLGEHRLARWEVETHDDRPDMVTLVCACRLEFVMEEGVPDGAEEQLETVHENHQAAMLAEAGLLRDEKAIADLGQSIIALLDQVGQQQPQIATQEPAGATQGASGDSRASGGLGERLRALGTGQTRTLRKALRGLADEVDVLEADLRFTGDRANSSEASYQQLMRDRERVRAQLVRMTKSSDEKTQRHGTALLHILDGKDAP